MYITDHFIVSLYNILIRMTRVKESFQEKARLDLESEDIEGGCSRDSSSLQATMSSAPIHAIFKIVTDIPEFVSSDGVPIEII